MARHIYAKRDGVWQWFDCDEKPVEVEAPFVQQDTLKAPLRHMVTGEVTESKSRLEQINREHGLKCVGNDVFSGKRRRTPKDVITEEMVVDRIQKAEAILSDPAKRNEVRYKQERLLELRDKLIGSRR